MSKCIFCQIVNKKIPAKIIYEDDEVLAFPDINGLAPVHILIIPKKHIESINHLQAEKDEGALAGKLIMVAQQIAQEQEIAEGGYKLLFRVGKHGEQEVPHIHLHLIGGAQLREDVGVA
jgi:histidine triad (HIT) family protein